MGRWMLALAVACALGGPAGAARAQEPGTLALRSAVDGVEVLLGDQRLGTTRAGYALIADNVPAGTYQLRARKAGYQDWQREVRVTASLRLEVTIDIEPLRAEPRVEPGPARVLFNDDFVRQRTRWTGSGSFCAARYDDTGYVLKDVHAANTCEMNFWGDTPLPERFRLEVTVRILRGPVDKGAGFKFGLPGRERGDEGFYFMVDASGRYALWQYKTSWLPLLARTVDGSIKTGYGAVNTLAVEVEAGTIRCFVNDRFVGSARVTDTTRGHIGLILEGPGLEGAFTNLRALELATR